MLVDVIIPTFNRAPLLTRAIDSVLMQSHQNFKLYVIDDGSDDDTQSVLANYSAHPKVHFLFQENKGVSAARNLGIRNSSAQWLCFLDSDDEWLSHKLKTQLSFLSLHPECEFIHSNEIWIRNGARVNAKAKFDKSGKDLFRRSLETCLISPSTVMVKRGLIEAHGAFDEDFEICEDYDLWLKILTSEEVGFIPDNLIKKYGGHEDQLSSKYPAMDYWRIRSMMKLLNLPQLSNDKRDWILDEIQRKAQILLLGYTKHQNHEKLVELNEMLKALK